MNVQGTAHLTGDASGVALVLDEPLSLWGGVDAATGGIIDRQHPQLGESITGRILVMPHGRGSSGGSGVLAECLRAGAGPAAIIMRELDPILLVGAVVAEELYGIVCPVIEVGDAYDAVAPDQMTSVDVQGRITQA